MTRISKAILLSAVSLFVDNGNVTYAAEQIVSSVPKSGIHTLHTHHTHIRHILQGLDLSSPLFDDTEKQGTKVASVCFITDSEDCSGFEFGSPDSPNNSYCNPKPNMKNCQYGTEYAPDGCGGTRKICKNCTPLPSEEGCQYGTITEDDGCGGTRTVCEDCTALPDEEGCQYGTITEDDGCGGTRTMCVDCTPLEDQTNCPYGTVSGDDGCGGLRAVCKECDPLPGESNCPNGTETVDDGCGGTRTICKECTPLPSDSNCPNGTVSVDDGCGGTRDICKDCTPLPSESGCKYGTTTASDGCGGTRTICKDCTPLPSESGCKYGTTTASDGCGGIRTICKDCANECSLTYCPSPFTCRYEECSKSYCKTGCEEGYDWDASAQTCTAQCPANYRYGEDNCPSDSYYHCSMSTCGGKYTDCLALSTQIVGWPNSFEYGEFTYAKSAEFCPSGEFAYESWVNISLGNTKYYQCLLDGVDTSCKALDANYTMSKDMYCGNLYPVEDNVTINGNGHTITFMTNAYAIFSVGTHRTFNNINIIHNVDDNSIPLKPLGCYDTYNPTVFNSFTTLNSQVYVKGLVLGGTAYVTRDAILESKHANVSVAQNAQANLLPNRDYNFGYNPWIQEITVDNNAVVNIKNQTAYNGDYIISQKSGAAGTATINICQTTAGALDVELAWWTTNTAPGNVACSPFTINTNRALDSLKVKDDVSAFEECLGYVTVNVNPSVCSNMNF